jgi:hypothetical protein
VRRLEDHNNRFEDNNISPDFTSHKNQDGKKLPRSLSPGNITPFKSSEGILKKFI